jgi:DegV family protein with EDD domain
MDSRSMNLLDGTLFFNAFSSGASAVIKVQNDLNKLNVFPVPDGDTGTNLASTMRYILELTDVSSSIGKTTRSIADAALMGARGNSGAIFAQYMHGLSNAIGNRESIDGQTFARAAQEAISYAYDAMVTPVEGTMLTVMKDWADALNSIDGSDKSLLEVIAQSNAVAQKSLEETPKKLAILKKAGVVDAGAKGFVAFIEGIKTFLSGKCVNLEDEIIPGVELRNHVHIDEGNIENRFCTEAIIEGTKLNIEGIKSIISESGDSALVAGTENKARIHVHTNEPAELFFRLKDFGNVAQQKVDDMEMQYRVSQKRKYPIALVVDSVCDLPKEVMDYYQIQMVPLYFNFGQSQYLDKITMKADQFYSMLDSAEDYPVSAQPGMNTFQNLYHFLGTHYDSVIAIHVSDKLSGTWNASKKAAERLRGKKISVINSRHVSGSIGLLVLKAAMMIEERRDHDEIVETIETLTNNARIFVSVNTLKYMVKGGRVSPVLGLVGKALNLKPIVSVDREGNSKLYGKAFSKLGNMKKILGFVEELNKKCHVVSYNITHAHAHKTAKAYEDSLTKLLGKKPEYIMEVSPVVGISAGIGAVSVSVLCERDTWSPDVQIK